MDNLIFELVFVSSLYFWILYIEFFKLYLNRSDNLIQIYQINYFIYILMIHKLICSEKIVQICQWPLSCNFFNQSSSDYNFFLHIFFQTSLSVVHRPNPRFCCLNKIPRSFVNPGITLSSHHVDMNKCPFFFSLSLSLFLKLQWSLHLAKKGTTGGVGTFLMHQCCHAASE